MMNTNFIGETMTFDNPWHVANDGVMEQQVVPKDTDNYLPCDDSGINIDSDFGKMQDDMNKTNEDVDMLTPATPTTPPANINDPMDSLLDEAFRSILEINNNNVSHSDENIIEKAPENNNIEKKHVSTK